MGRGVRGEVRPRDAKDTDTGEPGAIPDCISKFFVRFLCAAEFRERENKSQTQTHSIHGLIPQLCAEKVRILFFKVKFLLWRATKKLATKILSKFPLHQYQEHTKSARNDSEYFSSKADLKFSTHRRHIYF